MTRVALILLTAYRTSDLTWGPGWQQSLLGWPTGTGGIAPFAGPAALWLIVFAVLTAASMIVLLSAIRSYQNEPNPVVQLMALSSASAATCWYLSDRIAGV